MNLGESVKDWHSFTKEHQILETSKQNQEVLRVQPDLEARPACWPLRYPLRTLDWSALGENQLTQELAKKTVKCPKSHHDLAPVHFTGFLPFFSLHPHTASTKLLLCLPAQTGADLYPFRWCLSICPSSSWLPGSLLLFFRIQIRAISLRKPSLSIFAKSSHGTMETSVAIPAILP